MSITGKSPSQTITNSKTIVQQLKTEKDNKRRAELILQAANFRETNLSPSDRKYIVETFLEWYRNNPSPQVHSAIDRLFRHSGAGETPGKINWNSSDELKKIDQQLTGRQNDNKQWFVTAQLHTMSTIPGPVTFLIGSPPDEKYRSDDEHQHRVTISRSYAISTKEITVDQFQEFLEKNPSIKQAASHDSQKNPAIENKRVLLYSPEGDCPQIFVTWYEAAQYCNWLSKLDGLPESEWCYPPNEMIRSGMVIQKDYLNKKGYRLPTEAEWEYAARAGTTAMRFFGNKDGLLPEYARYSRNPPQRKNDPNDPNDPQHTYPTGQLKPNMFGLFDVYGNVWEWCDSRRAPYAGDTVDESLGNIVITDSVAMVRRGESFSYGKDVMRSAHRGATNYFSNQRRDNVGFRIAGTIE